MLQLVQDLKKGDLVLYPSNGHFIMARVLKDPEVMTNPPKWRQDGRIYYKNLRMSVRREQITVTQVYGDKTYTRKEYVFPLTADDHNYNKYFNPNGKEFWLLERKGV